MPEATGPIWLVERGIAETRAILVEGDEILATRLAWEGELRAGAVLQAQLADRVRGTRRGSVRLPDGLISLIDGLDPALTEGASLTVRVTRASIAERGRTKLPLVRPAPGATPHAADLVDSLPDHPVRVLLPTDRSFDRAGWDDLVEQAQTGEVPFPGGSLTISPTPAMTLIDVDGAPPLPALALAAIPAIASALLRLDIGGSVGIDFPSLEGKADRQAVDAALATALAAQGWKGERTGMNGFGFVQLVSRLEGPSLVARHARFPAASAARALLRRAERVAEPGVLLLTAHPAVRRAVKPEWEAELARRTGRVLRWQEDAGLALHAAFAQAVAA